eukprot:CAMPEP_0119546514 /NCGR_PEP_ID=MMETSP1352-20130426/902_1 /TAXON_ID=265584 /ORGANISM="Stauroneis constricta, Strain CCMP1120" /LENGTH=553 /DNA_ID=CAMNT_0007591225 /DNA_START=176 /DNA_END=1837 /DNA_ORIENTATION=-
MKIFHQTVLCVLAATAVAGMGGVNAVDSNASPNLRRELQSGSSCNDLHDQNSCLSATDTETDESCQWCTCKAVPSECLSADQAKLVPPSVFDCQSPSADNMFSFVVKDAKTSTSKTTTVQLQSEAVDSDICDPSSKSMSGYMDVKGSQYDKDGENKHLFYWMFEKRGYDPDEDGVVPFVVWLTGGPGCSSTLALLTENGPCSVNDDGKTTSVNPYSWTEAAHVLWLDQPAGVGFSYGTENDYNEEMISEDAYFFLQAFFQSHPEYASSPLFVIGESYGGHYAPAIAHRVWLGNKAEDEGTIKLNLSGVGVGNGLTKPQEQYKWYPDMVYNNSHGIKVVDEGTYEAMKSVVPKCTKLIETCNSGDNAIDEFACQSAFLVCNLGLTSPYQATGLNPYDIRKKCEKPPLCYDFSNVQTWLNDKEVRAALNVDESHSHHWESCNMGINLKFHVDWMKDFSGYVADMLDDGIQALIYAGDVDFICNYLGNKAWSYQLEWSGGDEFRAADEHEWNGAGLARTANGLTFLQVYDAGHMVPSDKPKESLDMLQTFLNGESF